ncbi:methyltransferase [Candidatus Micrarchaeota archaeon]|nr:methyltransferase [Candidatus Micrarchaeota archaeon]MBU1166711.1 methyltransferase [Candidatus Micrarchaeota archaeon]MBU1886776.1 methyltransferase [Candidatus Micrarchaeota archaeon]
MLIEIVLIAVILILVLFYIMNKKFQGNLIKIMQNKLFAKDIDIIFHGRKILLNAGSHPPTEDTVFFYKNLKDRLNGNVLEIGTGTGVFPILVGSKGIAWTCTDIDKKAIDNAGINFNRNEVTARTVLSNVFDSVNEKYDYIIWNFPYIVGSKEIMKKFICGLKMYLKDGGTAYISSSIIMKLKYADFEKDCEKLNIKRKIIARGYYFFVPIIVYELKF